MSNDEVDPNWPPPKPKDRDHPNAARATRSGGQPIPPTHTPSPVGEERRKPLRARWPSGFLLVALVGVLIVAAATIVLIVTPWSDDDESVGRAPTARQTTDAQPHQTPPLSPSAQPPTESQLSNLVGMIVVLDPALSGSDDSEMSRKVPDGRNGFVDCQSPSSNTANGYPQHSFNWETTLRVRQALTVFGIRTAMTRGNDEAIGACVDERAERANAVAPDAIVIIDAYRQGPEASGFVVGHTAYPSNQAQAAQSTEFARMMRDQLRRSGLRVSNSLGTDGVSRRANSAELNLARYPAISIGLGNIRNAGDAARMETEEGRQAYADAIVPGIVAFLSTRAPRPR